MRIQQLEYILKIVEMGNITSAAKALYISQPSLSNAVKALEQEMGITIFNRNQKGVHLTAEGEEFLQYAKQVTEQVTLMNHRYKETLRPKKIFNVAGQHYAFIVDAFVRLLNRLNKQDYQATLKEMRTYEVIQDVATLKSEIGIIYKSQFNSKVIDGVLKEHDLTFTPIYRTAPFVFLDKAHPLVKQPIIELSDLEQFPRLSYDQGVHNSFYYWEEILADIHSPKSIIVSDRATLFNLLIGLQGYTISSGIINDDLNGPNIVARPLNSQETIEIGYIVSNLHNLSDIAQEYLTLLYECIYQYANPVKQ